MLFPGLTDEEVELAIQRSGSTEEVLPLTPVGLPYPPYAAQLAPAPPSEYIRPLLPFDMRCIDPYNAYASKKLKTNKDYS